jgi:hypothetical protein
MKKLLATILFVPSMANAEFFNGNTLLNLMNGSVPEQIQALGYVQGVFDTLHSAVICPPQNVSAGQVNDMIKNYITNSPATRHHTADFIILTALKDLWPCQTRNRNL